MTHSLLQRWRLCLPAALFCAVAITGLPQDAAAQTTPAQAALLGAVNGTPKGLSALQRYLSEASGRPEQVQSRTGELIKALGGTSIGDDPVALQEAIASISQAARQALFATPISQVRVLDNFSLSPRSFGFDFGPPDSEVMSNFQHVTAKDPRLSGDARRDLRRPSSDQLLSDGVVNVAKFTTEIPNGQYRVVLLTDNLGIGDNLKYPLGQKVSVNGNSVTVAQNDPSSWLNAGILSGGGAEGVGESGRSSGASSGFGQQSAGANGTGGMLIVEVEVVDSKLVVDFDNVQNLSTYLTAVIVEPVDEKSNLDLRDEADSYYQQGPDRLAEANAKIDEQVGGVLSNIATAAGPQQIAEALGIQQPPVQPTTLTSAN